MTRGKDEEKMMGPMFPRLHVNDTEKGGPRAPPRNKMALYEQLSIPSQRFNHSMPHNNTSANLAPPSSQGSGNEMCKFFSGQLLPRHQSDTQNSPYTDISSPRTQVEHRAKSDEDDFRVPIFTNSFPSQESAKYTNEGNIEKPVPSKASSFSHAMNFPKAKDPSMFESSMGKEMINETRENPKELLTVQAASNLLVTKKNESPKNQINSSFCHEQGNYRDLSNVTESRGDGSYGSMDPGSLERADSVSETSILDSVVEDMITPDDVVGIIGQKHFWKARRAISNQQRVFAVQVFELHRLLKVQKLIAASPNLIEDFAYFHKPVKPLPVNKLPSNYPIKESINIPNHENDSDNQSQKKERSAENNVERTSLSSAQNGEPPSGVQPLASNSQQPSINSNQHANPWCFNQPQHGQQWLIPVMSPSEGLVFKPYPAPGFMGPAHGPPVPIPPTGNFYPPYPQPHPHYHQFPTFPGPHGYFPHGMPMMNGPAFSGSSVDQTNPSAINAQLSAGKANVRIPNPKRGGFPNTPNVNRSEDVEVQGSTASSQCDVPLSLGARGLTASSQCDVPLSLGARGLTESRNVLKLFPTSPVNESGDKSGAHPSEPERPTRVIRVVPHNARTATESAARIFQSIQEERKQYDSV